MMHKTTLQALAVMFVVTTCESTPVPAYTDPTPTTDDVLGVMARLPEERCLFNPKGKGCGHPAGYDKGPDAARIAAAIAASADGRITGTRREDAALIATFTSYESGNKADAVGDMGKALGALQLHYVGPDVAFDPARAVPYWRAIAVGTKQAPGCRDNKPDEQLAGIAGSCTYEPARRKVRQRMVAARAALGE